jgi:hypothetical protein
MVDDLDDDAFSEPVTVKIPISFPLDVFVPAKVGTPARTKLATPDVAHEPTAAGMRKDLPGEG